MELYPREERVPVALCTRDDGKRGFCCRGLGALPALQPGVSQPPWTGGARGRAARCEDVKGPGRAYRTDRDSWAQSRFQGGITLVPWVALFPATRKRLKARRQPESQVARGKLLGAGI